MPTALAAFCAHLEPNREVLNTATCAEDYRAVRNNLRTNVPERFSFGSNQHSPANRDAHGRERKAEVFCWSGDLPATTVDRTARLI
jgi:hypothetical protein